MILRELKVSSLDTNCYILGDEEVGEAIVIDPGDDGEEIMNLLDGLNLDLKYILDTHGHHDHISANRYLAENSDAELLIHEADAEYLTNPRYNLSFFHKSDAIEGPAADRLLVEGDRVKCGEWDLEVIHTPGHTPGGIVLLGNGKLFSGDTLFSMGVGRTDLPNGSREDLMASIEEKLMSLDDDLEVYPGHGPSGKLGEIKAVNPFL